MSYVENHSLGKFMANVRTTFDQSYSSPDLTAHVGKTRTSTSVLHN